MIDGTMIDGPMNHKKKSLTGVYVLAFFIVFVLVFTFLSLNLKTIELGYEMQELIGQEKDLTEEIDKLRAQKAELLKLERVEKLVMQKLGYNYPEPDQFIKVVVDE